MLSGFDTRSQILCMLSPEINRLVFFACRRSGDPAVLPDAPEVNDHEDRRYEGKKNTMADVKAEERRRSDLRPPEEDEADVIVDAHPQLRPERTLVAEERGGAGHVRADRHRPDRQLVPR